MAFEKPTSACFFQIAQEIMLIFINNVHEKIWAMHLQVWTTDPLLATLAVSNIKVEFTSNFNEILPEFAEPWPPYLFFP